jgi:tRNA (cytidine/uridine-2'-O-)-methyltransferase
MPRVVLFEPQIPPNTGNVARTCAATGCELHLVEPLGFAITDRQLKRAGLDYWPHVLLRRHASWQPFETERRQRSGRLLAFSSHAQMPYHQFSFQHDDWLLFGRETDGLPRDLLTSADALLTIPMACRAAAAGTGGVRSLNLSVSVGVVLFEALRQLGALDAISVRDDPDRREIGGR